MAVHATARWNVPWGAWLGRAAWVAAALLVVACGGLCVPAGRGLIGSGSWAVGLAVVVVKGVAVQLVGCLVRWVVWDMSRVRKAQGT